MSPPSAFGTFRVLHQIGSGVLGPVFRSYDSERDRLVAVKAFKLELLPEDARRFADALWVLAAEPPAHPAIVRAVDAGLEGNTPYLALEYASGDSLDVVLRQAGALPPATALPLLVSLARAIDASWERGVGHGALHPRDIFFTGHAGEVSVTGFGVAQALESVLARAPVRRPYGAPERTESAPWGRQADIYSLTAIAREMLAGARQAGTQDALGSVFTRGLAEQPGDRFPSAVSMIDALAAAIEAPVVETHEPPAHTPPAPTAPLEASDLPGADDALPEPLIRHQPAPAMRAIEIDVPAQPPAAADLTPEERDDAHRAFPWAAVAAVAAACLVLGGVIGYQIGIGVTRGTDAAAGASIASAAPPVDARQAAPVTPPVAEPPPTVPVPDATPAAPAAAGQLVIQSTPAGALAYVDGRRVGETPVTIPGVALGGHDIRVTRSGYVPATERVTLSASAPARTVRLQLRRGAAGAPAVTTGSLYVDSRPRGARVTLDGRMLGQTPFSVPELSPGDHRVLIDLAGHRPVTSTVKVVAGEQTRLAVSLERAGSGERPQVRKFR